VDAAREEDAMRNPARDGRWHVSDDGGTSWRKDFDLIFERIAT